MVETPEACPPNGRGLVPLAFRGAFYHISAVDQGAKAGFLNDGFSSSSGRMLLSKRSKRIWRLGGKLLQSRQR